MHSGRREAGSGDPPSLIGPFTARVTLITAPPGSGKGRLIDQRLAAGGDGVRIDLGPADRDVHPFPAPAAADLDRLADPAADRPVLAISGLEVLSAAQTCALVDHLLERLPDRVRLVLAGSGSGLPAPGLLRLSGDASVASGGGVVEIVARDLWLCPDQVPAQLVSAQLGPVPAELAAQLYRLTGGWPAGLAVLARAARTRPGGLARARPADDPDVVDLVTAVVIDRLDPGLREFVLRTSVLDELDPAAAAALVPGRPVVPMLAEVYRQGLTAGHWPTIPALPAHPAGGYHPFVRAAARRELASRPAGDELVMGLLRTAAEQARHDGDASAALSHLVGAKQWDAALDVLRSEAPTGFAHHDPVRLAAVVRSLPAPTWAGGGPGAERALLVAFAAASAGDGLTATSVLRRTPEPVRRTAPWWAVLMRLVEALVGSSAPGRIGYRAACSALVELDLLDRAAAVPDLLGMTDRPSLTAAAHLLAARAAVLDGGPASARRHLEAAWSTPGAQLPAWCLLAGLGADALTAAMLGELAAAARRSARAGRLADENGLRRHPVAGLALLASVETLRARGRIRPALAELAAGLPAIRRSESFVAAAGGGRPQTSAGEVLQASLQLDDGDVEAAAAALADFDAAGDDGLPPAVAAALAVLRARLHLIAGEVAAAGEVLAAAPDLPVVAGLRVAVALQRSTGRRGGDEEAAAEALRTWPAAEPHDCLDAGIRRLLAQAAVDLAAERRVEAAERVRAALVAGEPDGHVQVFVSAPPGVRALTSALLGRSPAASGWRQELAARLDGASPSGPTDPDGGGTGLTPRERAVLERLTTGFTHAQIAAGLFVSENTLKSHARNLYRKLGVTTRADAVRVARARGWLDPDPPGRVSPQGETRVDLKITLEPEVAEL